MYVNMCTDSSFYNFVMQFIMDAIGLSMFISFCSICTYNVSVTVLIQKGIKGHVALFRINKNYFLA
jgi:hypothetical protein